MITSCEFLLKCHVKLTAAGDIFSPCSLLSLPAQQQVCTTKSPIYSSTGSDRSLAEGQTIVSPHGEEDVSDHSPNSRRSDLLYGNHLSTERTPPAHHRGIYQRLFQGSSNISRGAEGGRVASPSLFVCSKILKDAYDFGLQVDLESDIEKHHYQHDDGGLLSLNVPLSKMT